MTHVLSCTSANQRLTSVRYILRPVRGLGIKNIYRIFICLVIQFDVGPVEGRSRPARDHTPLRIQRIRALGNYTSSRKTSTPRQKGQEEEQESDFEEGLSSTFRYLIPSRDLEMSDNIMEKVSAFGERLKISGSEVGRKMTEGMSSMSFKMKEFFQGNNQTDKLVEEATAEALDGPDWATNLEMCDMINGEKVNSVELIRGIKKRIMLKNDRVQYLALVLLETIVKNCEKAFSEVAAERVLDEMVKLIDDPQTVVNNRNKALVLIEAWGESGNELRYLPVFEETYKSLKSRGIHFPRRDDESLAPIFTPPRSVSDTESYASVGRQTDHDVPARTFTAEQTKEAFDVARNSMELLSTVLSSSPQQDVLKDDLTTTLVQQCQQCQYTIQRIIETSEDNESVLFEALTVNDELQKVISKYEDLKKPPIVQSEPEPAMIPIAVEPEESPRFSKEHALVRKPAGSRARSGEDDEMMDDLDEMIFGKKGGSSSEDQGSNKKRHEDDLISF